MKKVFVYGTLKRGEGNYSWIKDKVKFIKTAKVKGYELYEVNYTPIMVVSNKDKVVEGEVMAFKEDLFKEVKALELRYGYKEVIIDGMIAFVKTLRQMKKYSPCAKPINKTSWTSWRSK